MELIDDTEMMELINDTYRNNDRMELINDTEIMIGWS